MRRREFLVQIVSTGLVGGTASCLTGCGTVFHSERVGRNHSRDIDWKIAALDSLGLLLFFIPGVIAFVVDFSSGAIYLPRDCNDQCGGYDDEWAPEPSAPPAPAMQPHPVEPLPPINPSSGIQTSPSDAPQLQPPQNGVPLGSALHEVVVPQRDLRQQTIERVVSQQIGRPVTLNGPGARVSRLTQLDDFFAVCQRHRADREFGSSSKRVFERLSAT